MRRIWRFRWAIVDIVALAVLAYAAMMIRLDGDINHHFYDILARSVWLRCLLGLATMAAAGGYQQVWRYASVPEVARVVAAVLAADGLFFLAMVIHGASLPRGFYLLLAVLDVLAFVGLRLTPRVLWSLKSRFTRQAFLARAADKTQGGRPIKKVLIFGAGDAGMMLVREIERNLRDQFKICGFLDDDPGKLGKMVAGYRVLGGRDDIPRLAAKKQVKDIFLAVPSLPGGEIGKINAICQAAGLSVKTVPGMFDIVSGRVTVSQLRQIEIEDLLSRKAVSFDREKLFRFYGGKTVLITGAGGSIGGEIARQLAAGGVKGLVLFGRGENSIYDIYQEICHREPQLPVWPFIGDVRDETAVRAAFSLYRPQVVLHAAAHKHVPLMENQPVEAWRNNVWGSYVVARAAAGAGTELCLLVSTDKAVNPVSVMGASKRVAELIFVLLQATAGTTRMCAVRFGNVLGSRGSVVPMFRRQIAAGGPVTVTHPDMRRYFMTIPEACQLVLMAGARAAGGEIFLLNMGEPVKIVDLARDMIRLSGCEPDSDIEIRYTGIRPGEKLFEELWKEGDDNVEVVDNAMFKLVGLACPADGEELLRLAARQDIGAGEVMAALERWGNREKGRPQGKGT
ncbi:MAG: polysaccharide biosynthesis protein [Negativicutes bacterium]|nr:polysaccharide biosynthesis protein [Negativicutes bacterium]